MCKYTYQLSIKQKIKGQVHKYILLFFVNQESFTKNNFVRRKNVHNICRLFIVEYYLVRC